MFGEGHWISDVCFIYSLAITVLNAMKILFNAAGQRVMRIITGSFVAHATEQRLTSYILRYRVFLFDQRHYNVSLFFYFYLPDGHRMEMFNVTHDS